MRSAGNRVPTRGAPHGYIIAGFDAPSMSNIDHSIDEGLLDLLRSDRVCAEHAAWGFNGTDWYHDGRFYEAVRQREHVVATFAADSLEDLMWTVNDAYGWA